MKHLNEVISKILDPKITYCFFFLYLIIFKFENTWIKLLFCLVTVSTALVLIYKSNKLHDKDDHTFKDKGARQLRFNTFIILLLFSIIFIALSMLESKTFLFEFFLLLASFNIIQFFITYLFNLKISAHVAYTGYLISFFTTSFFIYMIIWLPIFIILANARIQLKKHTFNQVLIAFLLTIFFGLIKFI